LDLGGEIEDVDVPAPSKSSKPFISLPASGPSHPQKWCNNSNLAADHAAAGSFESAMKVQNKIIFIFLFFLFLETENILFLWFLGSCCTNKLEL
jgi:hypothetical protein